MDQGQAQQAEFGSNLQAFVNAKIISEPVAHTLAPNQREAIENLSQAQVSTVIEVHNAVGPVMVAKFI
jgi:hypothetical protein